MAPANDTAILHQILQQLGSIDATQKALVSEFTEERRQARENRKDLHTKVDELTDRVARGEGDNKVLGQAIAQTRDHVDGVQDSITEAMEDMREEVVGRVAALEDKIKKEIGPPVEDFKRMRNIGYGIAALIGLSGLSVGAIFVAFGEKALEWLRAWLKI